MNFLQRSYLTAASESNKNQKSAEISAASELSLAEPPARVQIRVESSYTTTQYFQCSRRANAKANPAPFDGPPALGEISSLFIC